MPAAVFGNVGDAERDRAGRAIDGDRRAAKQNLPPVGGSEAEKNAGQLGAAGPDEAGEADDFAGADGQVDIRDSGFGAAEVAGFQDDVADRDDELGEDCVQGSCRPSAESVRRDRRLAMARVPT